MLTVSNLHLTQDVEALLVEDPIVRLLLRSTCSHYEKSFEPQYTSEYDMARICHDDVLETARVCDPQYLIKFNRRAFYLLPICEIESMHGLCCQHAMHAGHLSIVQFLHDIKPIPKRAFRDALRGGHLAILKWVNPPITDWSVEDFMLAVRSGNVELLQWLSDQGCPWNTLACHFAAGWGHASVLDWFLETAPARGIEWIPGALECAVGSGDMETIEKCRALQLSHLGECRWTVRMFISPITNDDTQLIEWLRDPKVHGGVELVCPWDATTFETAVSCDSRDVVKWMRDASIHGSDNVCPWDERVCAAAAMQGNLDMLKWLRSTANGKSACPWDYSTFASALYYGGIEILDWCKHNGCEWSDTVIEEVATDGCTEVVEWCIANGYTDRQTIRAYIRQMEEED
jgi:hypothetical protein